MHLTCLAKDLVTQLQAGGDDAEAVLADVLETGLDAFETLAVSIPRKQRKAVKAHCERIEIALETQ